jgi:hypothetical protein
MSVLQLETILAHIASFERVHVHPDIPPAKLSRTRRVHQARLAAEETVLALYDDTAFGGAREGFILTAGQLLWKNLLTAPDGILLDEIDTLDTMVAEDGRLTLGERTVDMTLEEGLAAATATMLRHPTTADAVTDPMVAAPHEEVVWQLVHRHLGRFDRLYYAPDLPPGPTGTARGIHVGVLGPDEPVLVFYDDTVFGGGADGFLITPARICWKNIAEGPQQARWTELTPADIEEVGGGLTILGSKVSITGRAEHLPALVEALRAVSADLQRRPGAPGRCAYCYRALAAADTTCPSCGAPR